MQIVHGDIKPSNVLIGDNDEALLSDVGLARVLERGVDEHILSGEPEGTTSHMAPEVSSSRCLFLALSPSFALPHTHCSFLWYLLPLQPHAQGARG